MGMAVAGGAVCAGLAKLLDKVIAVAAVAGSKQRGAAASKQQHVEEGTHGGDNGRTEDAGTAGSAGSAGRVQVGGDWAVAAVAEVLVQQLPGLMEEVMEVMDENVEMQQEQLYKEEQQQQQLQQEVDGQVHVSLPLNHRAVLGYVRFLRSATIALVKAHQEVHFDQLVDRFIILLQLLLSPAATPQLTLLHLQMEVVEVQLNQALKPAPAQLPTIISPASSSSSSGSSSGTYVVKGASATAVNVVNEAAATAVLREAVLLGLRDLVAVAQRSHLLQLHKGLKERLQAGQDPVALQSLHQMRWVTNCVTREGRLCACACRQTYMVMGVCFSKLIWQSRRSDRVGNEGDYFMTFLRLCGGNNTLGNMHPTSLPHMFGGLSHSTLCMLRLSRMIVPHLLDLLQCSNNPTHKLQVIPR
jgi:hypothetical protein